MNVEIIGIIVAIIGIVVEIILGLKNLEKKCDDGEKEILKDYCEI